MSFTNRFQLLAVDDESDWRDLIERSFEAVEDVAVTKASGFEEARSYVASRYYDGAVIDLQLYSSKVDDSSGLRLVEDLRGASPKTKIIIATSDLKRFKPETRRLDQILAVLDKDGLTDHFARQYFTATLEAFRRSAVLLNSQVSVVDALFDKFGSENGRAGSITRPRIELEFDRLVRSLFGHLGRHTEDQHVPPTLEITQLDTQGMSGAVVCIAQVGLPLIAETANPHVEGGAVVVKFDEASKVEDEVRRFRRFVQYGVPLRHRVELTGHAVAGKLGALVYGFAGGGTSQIRSFDAAVAEGDLETVRRVLKDLFEKPSRQWYEIEGRDRTLNEYRGKRWPGRFGTVQRRLVSEANRWADRFPEIRRRDLGGDEMDRLQVGDTELLLPSAEYWTKPPFSLPMPTCIVHGDLHGGNVLIADDAVPGGQHVALIDYGAAGFGPRLMDFAFLMATVRLGCAIRSQGPGDPAVFSARERERQFAALPDDKAFELLEVAAKSGRIDNKILRFAKTRKTPHEADRTRAPISFALAEWAHKNFEHYSYDEWLGTMLLVAYRQAGHERVDSVGRIRTLAWVDALIRGLRHSQKTR